MNHQVFKGGFSVKKIHLAIFSSLVCLAPSLSALSRSEPKESHNPSQLTTSYVEEGQSTQEISKNQPSNSSSQQSSTQKKPTTSKNKSTTPVNEGAVPSSMPPPPAPSPQQPAQPPQQAPAPTQAPPPRP